jgi:hypothetical protein
MLDKVLSQLNGPLGIVVALVVVLIVLFLVRKILSLVFLVLAVALGGWAAAREFNVSIPFVLPGKITEAVQSAVGAAAKTVGATVHTESAGARALGAPETPAAQSAAAQVRAAKLAHNAPSAMTLNMPVSLRLAVDPSGGNPEDALAGLPGGVRTGQAELTPQVTASLYGSGFDIRALKPARQVLAKDAVSTWEWEVTPREAGAHTLYLEVFAHPGGGEAAASVKTYEDKIDVKVTIASEALHFVQTVQPLAGFLAAGVSLALAAIGFFANRGRKRVTPW